MTKTVKSIVDDFCGTPTNWACDAPWDAEAKYNQRTVFSEDQIVSGYADGVMNRQETIDDWVVVNWAFRTDMPPGEYVTKIVTPLRYVIKEAYDATYSKPSCSRDYVVREILERAMGEGNE